MNMEDYAKFFIRKEPAKGLNWMIGSPPDREKLVAELYKGNIQWGEIHQETDALTLEIYAEPNGLPWAFPLHELTTFLEEAERQLTGGPSESASRQA